MYVDESHGFQALTEVKDKSQSSRGRNPEAKPKLSRPDAPLADYTIFSILFIFEHLILSVSDYVSSEPDQHHHFWICFNYSSAPAKQTRHKIKKPS